LSAVLAELRTIRRLVQAVLVLLVGVLLALWWLWPPRIALEPIPASGSSTHPKADRLWTPVGGGLRTCGIAEVNCDRYLAEVARRQARPEPITTICYDDVLTPCPSDP